MPQTAIFSGARSLPNGTASTLRHTTHALSRTRTSCSDARDKKLLAVAQDNVQDKWSVTGTMDRIVILQRDMDENQGTVELLCSAG